MASALRRRATGLPVTFTGFIAGRNAIAEALRRSDVTIAPCPGECFGLAALESMACGTPVVVAEHSGASELVVDGGGFAVAPGAVEMAHAVAAILDRPEAERRREARLVAESFPWSQSVEAMLGLYERLGLAA